MTTEEKMLKNFMQKYGYSGLKKISVLFKEGTSNQVIAEKFSVTRQRVHQWQKAFVDQKVILKPHVEKALHPKG